MPEYQKGSSRSYELLGLWLSLGEQPSFRALSPVLFSAFVNSTCIPSLLLLTSGHVSGFSGPQPPALWPGNSKQWTNTDRARFLCFPYFRSHCLSFPHVQCFANHCYMLFLCFEIASTGKVNLASVTPSCPKSENVKYTGFWIQNFSACEKNIGEITNAWFRHEGKLSFIW